MRFIYLAAGLAAVLVQAALLDGTSWSFLALPLLVALIAYLRRGFAASITISVITMWLWDIHAFTFGLRAAALLLTLMLVHLLKIMILSPTKWLSLVTLSAAGVLLYQLWMLLGSAVILGWHYYFNLTPVIWYGLASCILAGLLCALFYYLAERYHTIVKR
ncbi:MAG: hypothetical protein V1846_01845 [Candidatus Komeilibacteria bacterium]